MGRVGGGRSLGASCPYSIVITRPIGYTLAVGGVIDVNYEGWDYLLNLVWIGIAPDEDSMFALRTTESFKTK